MDGKKNQGMASYVCISSYVFVKIPNWDMLFLRAGKKHMSIKAMSGL